MRGSLRGKDLHDAQALAHHGCRPASRPHTILEECRKEGCPSCLEVKAIPGRSSAFLTLNGKGLGI